MKILVFNCGSSSLNYKIFQTQPGGDFQIEAYGKAHRVGVTGKEAAFIEHNLGGQSERQETPVRDHREAAQLVLERLSKADIRVDAIGHRFVHGGTFFEGSALVTNEVRARLEETLSLAPIHNPNSLSVIDACRQALPTVPQYVAFDTAFHVSLPPRASQYALPRELVERYGLRRYGFHGLSYQYISRVAPHFLGLNVEGLRMVACHLGTGGSSVAAIYGGRSVDTTMGFSPLAGLVMGTRTGDLDAMLPLYLERELNYDAKALNEMFNKHSGLLGLSGFSSDLRDIQAQAEAGDDRARLAFEVYTHRLKKAIGAYAVLLGGLDVLVFTDDIGVQNWRVREAACQGLSWCGLDLDLGANRRAPADRPALISDPRSRVRVVSMPTDEERIIAEEGVRLLQEADYAAL